MSLPAKGLLIGCVVVGVVGLLVVGSLLAFFFRRESSVSANEAPVANLDHWHAAFGINICGEQLPALADVGPDVKGIHSHQDGLIHIHPFVPAAAGDNAVFSVFAEQTGIGLGDGEFTLPDGTTWADGDECRGEDVVKGRVAMYVWPANATHTTEPKVITEDLGAIRFSEDGQALVLAFVPDGAAVELPPSVEEFGDISDLSAPDEGHSAPESPTGGG
jgi:hypothetical protein